MRPVGNPPRGMIIGRKRASALAGILRIPGYVVASMLVVSRCAHRWRPGPRPATAESARGDAASQEPSSLVAGLQVSAESTGANWQAASGVFIHMISATGAWHWQLVQVLLRAAHWRWSHLDAPQR